MYKTMEKSEKREWVVIKNKGEQLFGILHRPLSIANPPIVIFLHGFASSKQGSNRSYVIFAEALAQAGFAALRFDFRGCGDSEGALAEMNLEDLVSDALSVLHCVDEIDGIDSERIALFGASLGGTIALMAASRFQRTKAIALWAPVASGELWYRDFLKVHPEYINSNPETTLESYRGIKLSPEFREQFGNMEAYKNLKELNHVPLLFMHGEGDQSVSITHQEAYQKSFSSFGGVARFIKYPHAEHTLGFSTYFPEVIEETKSWFQRYLQ